MVILLKRPRLLAGLLGILRGHQVGSVGGLDSFLYLVEANEVVKVITSESIRCGRLLEMILKIVGEGTKIRISLGESRSARQANRRLLAKLRRPTPFQGLVILET